MMKIKFRDNDDKNTVAIHDGKGVAKRDHLLEKGGISMELVLQKTIDNILIDGYSDNTEAWFTRTQIGKLLGYSEPRVAISKIHNAHKDRLDRYSTVTAAVTVDGKKRDTFLYNLRGAFEICRWSEQPKADDVMDKLYDMAEEVIKKGYYSALPPEQLINAIVSAADSKDRYPLVIEAIRASKIDHANFVSDLTGIRQADIPKKLTVVSNENRHGRVLTADWKKHGYGDFTAKDLYGKSDLDDYIIDAAVEKLSRQKSDFSFYNFIRYCGEIHFTKDGYLAVLDYIDKMGYLRNQPGLMKQWRSEIKNAV